MTTAARTTATVARSPAQRRASAPQPLPRGRHKLSLEDVRASQRERLLDAMLMSVAEHGYAATTVPQVVAAARVGRNAFYELFADKSECFLALCEKLADQIVAELMSATDRPDALSALRAGTRTYLSWWIDHPEFAQAYLVEMPGAGQRAVAARDALHARFEPVFAGLAAWLRRDHPGLPDLRPRVLGFIAPSLEELVAKEVRAGRLGDLLGLESDVVFLTALLLADDATAQQVSAT